MLLLLIVDGGGGGAVVTVVWLFAWLFVRSVVAIDGDVVIDDNEIVVVGDGC